MKLKKYRKLKQIDRWFRTIIIAMSLLIIGDWAISQTITLLNIGRLQVGNDISLLDGANLNLLSNSSTIRLGASSDTILTRDAANILALKNGNVDQTQRWYGSNNSYFQIKSSSELLTINAAASTDTAMTIPTNAVVRGVAVRTVTAIPAPAANYTVTGATSGTTFNTVAVGVGAGSTDVGTQNTPYKNGVAQAIRITPDVIPGAATGQVRIVLFYEIPSPPTS